MAGKNDQGLPMLRRWARMLVLPLVLAFLLFQQTGLQGSVEDALHSGPAVHTAQAHLAAIKPAKPELRLRGLDLLSPDLPDLPRHSATGTGLALPQPQTAGALRAVQTRHARAPPTILA
jgi:hypothetical protein